MGKGKNDPNCAAAASAMNFDLMGEPGTELTPEELEAERIVMTEQEIADQALKKFTPTFFYSNQSEISRIVEDPEDYPVAYPMVTRLLDHLPNLAGKTEREKLKWLKAFCDDDDSSLQSELSDDYGAEFYFARIDKRLDWVDKYPQSYAISSFDRQLSFMTTIWCRGHAGRYCSQQWMQRQLSRVYGYGRSIPQDKVTAWLKIAGFNPRKGVPLWPQQTRGQRILSRRKDDLAPLLDEAAISAMDASFANERIISQANVLAQGGKHEDAYDQALADATRQLRDTHDYTRHQINSKKHQEIMERLFPEDAVFALSKIIQRKHVREGSILERKDMELALRDVFEGAAGVEVAPELSETDPVDINIKKLTGLASGKKPRAAIQVKTHVNSDPDGNPDHQTTSLALMSAGSKSSPEEISEKIRKRLKQTDIYMCVDIHTDQRPGTNAETTHYHVNSIKPEVLKQIRNVMNDEGFWKKPCSVEVWGTTETEDLGPLGYSFSISCAANGAVSINNIPANCMERVVSINTPAPSACQQIIHWRYKNILAGRKPRSVPKRQSKPRGKTSASSGGRRTKAKKARTKVSA